MRFLDLGTGSGILGLACAKLGLVGEGLDIDLPAVENALENRTANAVDPTDFAVRLGGVEEAAGPYDFIVANILAAPLREMAPAIAALKSPALVLSGLLDMQADAVEAAYIEQGYAKARRMISGEWAALIFT
jgi:ribosomal protein L11 methyltransferase